MRLERLKLKGLIPFPGEVEIDLTQIDGQLIAVTGSNGSGKSSLMEAFPAAMFRAFPTRGKVSSIAVARDSLIEATVVNGKSWTLRQHIDAVSGKGETEVLDADGRPVLDTTSVRASKAWAAKHLPPPEVLFASTFAYQGSGGLLDLTKGERKGVIIRAIGVEHYEHLARAARAHESATRGRLETLAQRIADERRRGGEIEPAEAWVARAKRESGEALMGERAAEEELQEARAANERRAEVERQYWERQRRVAAVSQCWSECTILTGRIAGLEELLKHEPRIRSAAAQLTEHQATQAALQRSIADAERDREAHQANAATCASMAASAAREQESAERRAARAREALACRDEVREAEAEIAGAREELAALRRRRQEIEDERERVQSQHIAGAGERITRLRDALTVISEDDTEGDAATIADSALEADDAASLAARTVPKRAAELASEWTSADSAYGIQIERVNELSAVIAKGEHLPQAERDLVDAEREAAEAKAKADKHSADELTAQQQATRAGQDIAETRETLAGTEAVIAELQPIAAQLYELEQARVRVEELQRQLDAKQKQVETLEAEIAALPQPAELPPPGDVDGAESRLSAVRARVAQAERDLAVAETTLQRAQESAGQLKVLTAEHVELTLELTDWVRLRKDLGRDGLQAAEIDSAIPELTEITNHLLHTCFGPRFTVTMDTVRTSAKGKEVEDLIIQVLDTHRGTEHEAETLSGGERVIVGEALALALSVLSCRRLGIERPTLVRDESGASLDPENGRAYVRMLRQAAGLIGADKVLYVSHTPELQGLADARLVVADGTVTVEGA